MAYQGFGKNSGPSAAVPKAQIPFGQVSRPPSPTPPLSGSPIQRSPREVPAPGKIRSPPLIFQDNRYVAGPFPSAGVYRRTDSHPKWSDGEKSFFKDYNVQTPQRPPVVTSLNASHNYGAGISANAGQFQDHKRTRSPMLSTDEDILRNSRTFSGRPDSSLPAGGNQPKFPGNYANSLIQQDQSSASSYVGPYDSGRSSLSKHVDIGFPKLIQSAPLLSVNGISQENSRLSFNDSKRPTQSPPVSSMISNVFSNAVDSQNRRYPQPARSNYNEAVVRDPTDFPVPKRSRSPPTDPVFQGNYGRSNVISSASDSQIHQRSPPTARSGDIESVQTKPVNSLVPKRTRSPPSPSTDQFFHGNSISAEDDNERELQAKAKRLARFKVELSEPVQSTPAIADQKFSTNRHNQFMLERQKFVGERPPETVGDFLNGNALSDPEALESSSIITGLCQDMCPESERGERERKGDLDLYERLDGDRNQTSKSLAVKKYTRTAMREADLIRPMPVLQKTMDYLLNLLDQPYDDTFLGLYNFLWDRMRAIRMDLRMQHIFNLEAITMLEQMIRLHIIAMHELCEYTKGEGFVEGFDAHLNIEQMNKTSVELFQLYDDHRKKGIKVPTEKEFRGYYALLKLDKHPGYKVEPAELSLELAKLTPEIRQTPEVLFARDVARACRTGNFVAFFRLARKASYLQACLMHAHFAKLRTQALAALHCGLQNNQGIPLTHAAKWLGMEEEDIENLLEYHGFLIKEFEEQYMVKEGPFLNSENDHPVKCSRLVHLKKSGRIVEDISSPCLAVSSPVGEVKELRLGDAYQQEVKPVQVVETESSALAIDEEMPDHEPISSPRDAMPFKTLAASQLSVDGHNMASVSPLSYSFSYNYDSPRSQQARVGSVGRPNYDTLFRNSLERKTHTQTKEMPSQILSGRVEERFPDSQIDSAIENPVAQVVFIEDLEDEELIDIHQKAEDDEIDGGYHDEDVAEAKLKLILRIWRRRSIKKRVLRVQRQLAANAALNLLSLGPPIRLKKDEPSAFGEFNIDHIMSERYKKHEQSWSRMNVSDVIAGKLCGRNPDAKCVCWKIVLCSQADNHLEGQELGQWSQAAHLTPSPWLLSKLMPRKDDNDDLVISFPGLSIWKKFLPCQYGDDPSCCLSVINDAQIDHLNEAVLGASAILFLVSESIPWELQKIRLHNLIISLPSGSCLPLLILSGAREENSGSSQTMVENLGLHDIDKSRIRNFLIVFLVKSQQSEHLNGFFSDEQLREGLKWLASEAHIQPILSRVKTRELVLTHLNSSLEVLDKMNSYEVGPNHCISAFNEALERSLWQVVCAANANPACWPCPEIAMLEESSYEHRAAKLYLPTIGWSTAARIQQLVDALNDTKLPTFPDDISWLYRGSNSGEGIENQRQEVEDCLIRYLTKSTKMMGIVLAAKEASVMLQKGARLELRNSTYYIVPNWVMVFRRIFNWRLMNLSNGAVSTAYILRQHDFDAQTSGGVDKLAFEGSTSSPYLIHPSLDEMVEVGCSTFMSGTDRTKREAFQLPSSMVSDISKIQEGSNTSERVEERNSAEEDKLAGTNEDAYITNGLEYSSRSVGVTNTRKEADKLSKLLEQCNMLQDVIDEKLSIYF